MPLPPKPPPKKPTGTGLPAAADTGARLRRSLTADGFQAAAATPMALSHGAAMDRWKAIAGISKKLNDRAKVSRELTQELDALAKSPMSGDEWQLLQRVILSGPAPTTDDEADAESRRFIHDVEGPLARVASSWHLRRLREAGALESELYRGADIVLEGGGHLHARLAEINSIPGKGPFPGARLVRLTHFGVLYFARHGEKDLVLRLEAPLVQMRLLAPLLMKFFEEHFAKDQNVGPLGCSPLTLRSGKQAIFTAA